MPLITLSGVATADTPEIGRQKWNLNDVNLLSVLESHVYASNAHQVVGDTSSLITESGVFTLANKTIDSALNTMYIRPSALLGPVTTIRALEHGHLTNSSIQDFSYDSDQSQIAPIHVSGHNGIVVDKLTANVFSDGVRIRVPEVAVFNETSQSLALGSSAVEVGETFKVGGSSTFAGQLRLSASQSLKITHTASKFEHAGTTDSTSPTTGAVQVAGGVGIGKSLYVGADINLSGMVRDVNSSLTLQDSSFNTYLRNQNSSGKMYIQGYDIYFRDEADTDQYVQIDGGAITTTGKISITEDDDNTFSSGDGALQVTGGAYVAKNLTIGTGARIMSTNTLSFNQPGERIWSSAPGQLDITAGTEIEITATTVDLNGALVVSLATSLAALNTTGIINLNNATSNTLGSLDGALIIDGGVSIAENLTISGDVRLNTTKGISFNTGGTEQINSSTADQLDLDAAGAITMTAPIMSLTGNLAASGTSSLVGDVTVTGDILTNSAGTSDLGTSGTPWGNIYTLDSKKIYLGSGQDSELYSDGTNTKLDLQGSSTFSIRDAGNQELLVVDQSSVILKHEGITKLNTIIAGVEITGDATVSGDLITTGAITGDSLTITGTEHSFTADQADKLSTAQTIQLTGEATGTTTFDGTATASIDVNVTNNGHTHTTANITGLDTALGNSFDVSTGATNTIKSDITIDNWTTYTEPAETDTIFTNSNVTKKNKLFFAAMGSDEDAGNSNDGGNSNDSGHILHETSNETADRDKSIIHICPSDNASANVDLVAFHGRGHTLGSGVTIDMAGNINTPGSIHSGTTSFTSDSNNPLDLGGWALANVLVSPNNGHILNFVQLDLADMATGNNGSNSTTHIRSVNGAIQVQGMGPNNEKGGFRVGAFDPSGSAGNGGDASDQLGEGYLLAKKAIMAQEGLYAYARKGPTTQKGAPAAVTIFAQTGWKNGTEDYITSGVSGIPVLLSTEKVRFPCRGIYRVTTTVYMDEGGSSENMRFMGRLRISKDSSTSNAEHEYSNNEYIGNHWFNEGEHNSWGQEQFHTSANIAVIDPTQGEKFSDVSDGGGNAYVFWDLDSALGADNVHLISIMIELVTPLASGNEYIYEG